MRRKGGKGKTKKECKDGIQWRKVPVAGGSIG